MNDGVLASYMRAPIAESAWRSAVDLSGRRLPLGALGGGSRIRAFAVSLGCSALVAGDAFTGLRVSGRLGYVVGAFGAIPVGAG
jgi:hypothetical protein